MSTSHQPQPEPVLGDSPFFRFLGMTVIEASKERVVLQLPCREEFRQEEGVVHGGVITALADTAAAYSVAMHLPKGTRMPGVELKLNFLRPAMIGAGDLVANGTVLRVGRRISVGEALVFQDEREVAKASFTFLILGEDSASQTAQGTRAPG